MSAVKAEIDAKKLKDLLERDLEFSLRKVAIPLPQGGIVRPTLLLNLRVVDGDWNDVVSVELPLARFFERFAEFNREMADAANATTATVVPFVAKAPPSVMGECNFLLDNPRPTSQHIQHRCNAAAGHMDENHTCVCGGKWPNARFFLTSRPDPTDRIGAVEKAVEVVDEFATQPVDEGVEAL